MARISDGVLVIMSYSVSVASLKAHVVRSHRRVACADPFALRCFVDAVTARKMLQHLAVIRIGASSSSSSSSLPPSVRESSTALYT